MAITTNWYVPSQHSTVARSASAVTPSETTSINTNRKSNTRFPMSLRWSSYVAPKPPKWNQRTNRRFRCKIALRLKEVCYKFSLCEKCQRQSCKAFIGLNICAKMIGGGRPLLPEILGQTNFQLIFVRNASSVTPSDKSSVNTNRKSTTRFPMNLRWSSYVAPKSPKGAQKRKTAVFRLKSHFAERKSATKFLCVKIVSDKVVRHSLA